MGEAEIIVVKGPDDAAADQVTRGLQMRLHGLGARVTRLTPVDHDVQLLADEVGAALRRAPALVLVVSADAKLACGALAVATERGLVDGLPGGASALGPSADSLVMLEATSHLVLVPLGGLDALWSESLGPSLAEWLGRPIHTRGELVLLDTSLARAEALVERLARDNAAVYIKARPDAAGGAVRIVVLARGDDEAAHQDVDAALTEVQRAASIARLSVSSTGRQAAHRVEAGAR